MRGRCNNPRRQGLSTRFLATPCALAEPESIIRWYRNGGKATWVGHRDAETVWHYYHLHDPASREAMERLAKSAGV